MNNPYEILQVSRQADFEVIEAAYRSLARKYLDLSGSNPSASKKLQEVEWAYRDPPFA